MVQQNQMAIKEQKAQRLSLLKGVLNNETMKKNFENILKENSGAFMASIIELYQSDNNLQECEPNKVVMEALKAATLKLPITKALGFAYIIPYGKTPTFTLGYKGLIQLAQRSGQYRYINADMVYDGESVKYDRVTGMLTITGEAKNDNPVGYFAFFELLNGYRKSVYWTKEKVIAHARRYSQSFSRQGSPWQTQFDAMALKTVLKNILSKYGVMSVEFASAISGDNTDERIEAEVAENANMQPIIIPDIVEETTIETGVESSMANEAEPDF